MKLELFIADMNRPQLTGKQTLRVVPFSETTTMTLDAKAMGISKVEVAGVETTFVYENNKLTLTFNTPSRDEHPELVDAEVIDGDFKKLEEPRAD